MRVTLYIPTIPKHFDFLDKILTMYYNGTVKPDYVLISVSEANLISDKVDNLEYKFRDYFEKLIILRHNERIWTANNLSFYDYIPDCDIIVYQDSDDYPHIQRIEIIKKIFEEHDIVSLNHSYILNKNSIYESEELNNLIDSFDIIYNNEIVPDEFNNFCLLPNSNPVSAGGISIRKDTLIKEHWGDGTNTFQYGQDVEYCWRIKEKYQKSMVISAKLIQYNIGLSSYIEVINKKKEEENQINNYFCSPPDRKYNSDINNYLKNIINEIEEIPKILSELNSKDKLQMIIELIKVLEK